MKRATFYILHNCKNQKNSLYAAEQLICDISAKYWRKGKSVLIYCENKDQAFRVDTFLWKRPLNSFIPHDILEVNNTSQCISSIKITWWKKIIIINSDILINLSTIFSDFSIASKIVAKEVIDFIPFEEYLKSLARERYRLYRSAGFEMNISIWK